MKAYINMKLHFQKYKVILCNVIFFNTYKFCSNHLHLFAQFPAKQGVCTVNICNLHNLLV